MKLPTPRLAEGPTVFGHRICYNDERHRLSIDGSVVRCSPSEYAVLMPLLWAQEYVPVATFVAYSAPRPLTRHVLASHVSGARAKLWPFGLDIVCVISHGYMVIALPSER